MAMLSNFYQYSRERRKFGRQCAFIDRTLYMVSVNSSVNIRMGFCLRNPVIGVTNEALQKALTIIETENVTFSEHGMIHYEGGWPKEVNIHDEEATLRHRKKVEREDAYGAQVMYLINLTVKNCFQNAAVNIYEEFFIHIAHELAAHLHHDFEGRQLTLYHDAFKGTPRPSTCVDWSPASRTTFIALHTYDPYEEPSDDEFFDPEEEEEEEEEESESESESKSKSEEENYVYNYEEEDENREELRPRIDFNLFSFYEWELDNPVRPQKIFEASGPATIVRYCPKEETQVAAAFKSGSVAFWDAEVGGQPLKMTPLEISHRDPCSSLCWVHSKLNNEFYSGSWGGEIRYWDINKFKGPEHIFFSDPVPTDEQKRQRAHGITAMEFEYTIPIRFIVCTCHGHIFIGNRKGTTPSEALVTNYKLFKGPIRTIERNPFFVKYFLITSDWCCKIWAEEFKTSPTSMVLKKHDIEFSCATWSHARCSVFVTGDKHGLVEFYDLLLSHRTPVFKYQYPSPIIALKFRQDGHLLAVSLESGDTHILELDPAFKKATSKEKSLIAALFERELLRGKLLEQRFDEIKLKRKTRQLRSEKRVDPEEEERRELIRTLNPAIPDEYQLLMEIDIQYKEVLNAFHDITGKIEAKREQRVHHFRMSPFERASLVYTEPIPCRTYSRMTEWSLSGPLDPKQKNSAYVDALLQR